MRLSWLTRKARIRNPLEDKYCGQSGTAIQLPGRSACFELLTSRCFCTSIGANNPDGRCDFPPYVPAGHPSILRLCCMIACARSLILYNRCSTFDADSECAPCQAAKIHDNLRPQDMLHRGLSLAARRGDASTQCCSRSQRYQRREECNWNDIFLSASRLMNRNICTYVAA